MQKEEKLQEDTADAITKEHQNLSSLINSIADEIGLQSNFIIDEFGLQITGDKLELKAKECMWWAWIFGGSYTEYPFHAEWRSGSINLYLAPLIWTRVRHIGRNE